MADRNIILEKIKSIKGLPTLPEVVQNATMMLENPLITAQEIGNVISKDIAISSKVLKLVNSSFYGFPRTIDTISQAVVILGFNTLKNTILSVGIIDAFPSISGDNGFDEYGFWLHSIGVATAARVTAEVCGIQDPERAFIGGLLHDVGRLMLALFFSKELSEVTGLVHDKKMPLLEAEEKVLSTNHALVGKWLVEKWNLTEDLQNMVRYHHIPMQAVDSKEQAAIVCCGNVLANALELGEPGDPKIPDLSDETWETLRLTTDKVDLLMKISLEKFENAKNLLNISRYRC